MKFIKQLDEMDCGPTCLKKICDHYGKYIPLNRIRQLCQISKTGTSLKSISTAGEEIGYRSLAATQVAVLSFPSEI